MAKLINDDAWINDPNEGRSSVTPPEAKFHGYRATGMTEDRLVDPKDWVAYQAWLAKQPAEDESDED